MGDFKVIECCSNNCAKVIVYTTSQTHSSYKQKNNTENKKSKVYTHIDKKNADKEYGAYKRNIKYTCFRT
jgi:hypothetical protein